MQKHSSRSPCVTYFLWGVVLWVFVDWGTAGGFRWSYVRTHGPLLAVFYVGYPLIFAYLIFVRGWRRAKLFAATAVAMLIIEGVLTRNPFVLSFPLLLIGIPLALCIYASLTFFPLWIVNGELKKHRAVVACLSTVVLVVMGLTTFGARNRIGLDKSAAEPSLFVRTSSNPVYESSGSSWNFAGIGDPTVVYDPGQNLFKMWTSAGGIVRPRKDVIVRIQYLTSKNGIAWVEYPRNPVLTEGKSTEWDAGGVETPFVLKDGSAYWMWFGGYRKRQHPPTGMCIGLATSNDGITWTKCPSNPVLRPGPPGSWDEAWVESPTVVRTATNFCMWYSGINRSQDYRIGLATSTDGVHWTKSASNPVLSPEPANSWESGLVYAPSVLDDGTEFRMWYVGLNPTTFLKAMRIGLATSSDGVVWKRSDKNPVLGLGAADAWDANGAFVPSVLFRGGTYWMWYLSGRNPHEKIGLATWSPVPSASRNRKE